MSVIKTLNNKSFSIPEPGDQNYAEDLSKYLQELADVVNSLQGPLDILETDFSFANNNSTPTDISGFIFTTSEIAEFTATYIITRDNGINKITERGNLYGFQTESGWEISRANASNDVTNTKFPLSNGDIGIDFTVTPSGQLQYTSNDYSGQITGTITFKAKTTSQ